MQDNMDKHHYTDGFTTLETCIWASRDKDGNKKAYAEYIIVMDWCKTKGIGEKDIENKIIKDGVNNYMNEYSKKHSPLETCLHVYRDGKGNIKPQPKLGYILSWCKEHGVSEKMIKDGDKKKGEEKKGEKTETEDFKIDKSYSVSIKRDEKTALFKHFEFKKSGSAQSDRSNGRPLYIFVHGWGGNPSIWAEGMSKLISGNPQILFVDWRDIASRDSMQIAPYSEAKWIDAVADKAVEALKEWGIDNRNTTIIGHSLGTILGAKLAVKLEGVSNTSGIKNVKMIMLDPAAYVWEYRTDMQGTTFSGFGGNGLCIVADDSIPGSEKLMNTCKEKYLIEYDDPMNNSAIKDFVDLTIKEYSEDPVVKLYNYYEHIKTGNYKELAKDATCKVISFIPYVGSAINYSKLCEAAFGKIDKSIQNHLWVYTTYSAILKYPFKGNVLMPGISSDFTENKNGIHGIIYTERGEPEKIKYLKTGYSDNMFKLIGNTQSNKMECVGKKECVMYGYHGADKFSLTIDHNNSTIKDFRNRNNEDKLFIEDINKKDISCFGAGVNSSDSSIKSVNNKEILGCTGSGSDTSIRIGKFMRGELFSATKEVTITLEGKNVSTVSEWMKILHAKEQYTDPKTGKIYIGAELKRFKKDNPIQIQ